jgi:hypothetical protein
LWCAISTCMLMRRLFAGSIRGAVHPARLCYALGGPAEASVDAGSRAVMD